MMYFFGVGITLIGIGLFVYSILPNLLTRVFRIFAVHKGPNKKEIALTFDDGPDAAYTNAILEILAEENVHATFFVLAKKAIQSPDLIQRMIVDGHDVQIHGMEHYFVPGLFTHKSLEQVRGASTTLMEYFGIQTSLYRPTWGLCNLPALVCAHKIGHTLITWSVMVGDWRKTSAEILLQRIQKKLRNGAIIVLHDSDDTPGAEHGAPLEVIRLLPRLIQGVRENGYAFATVSAWLREG